MKRFFILTLVVVFTILIGMNILAKNAISQNETPPMSTEIEEPIVDSKLIVYYFYTTARCVACHKIEQYTKEALESSFADAMSSGKIDFQMLNVDEPQNKHYIQDYQLYTKSVVLSKIEKGKEVSYKNLDKIWKLLGNKEKFAEYIESETQSFLEKDKEM